MGTWRGWFVLLAVLSTLSPTTVAQSDTEPPVLVDFDFDPKSVDVTNDSANVTCSMHVTDNLAGATEVACFFVSPARHSGACRGQLTSGDYLDGVFECTLTISQYAEAGTWLAEVDVRDSVSNHDNLSGSELQQLGFPHELSVTSPSDTASPALLDFDFQPRSVDVTNDSADVSCSMHVTDAIAGAADVACIFVSPSGHSAGCYGVLTSGDVVDGVWECPVTLTQYSEQGTWLAQIDLRDSVSNHDVVDAPELQALGFPSELNVTSPSDAEPPVLLGFDFHPQSVDVSNDSASVLCSVHVTDVPAGATEVDCVFVSLSRHSGACDGVLTSGDFLDGVWECSATISQYSEEGPWFAEVHLQDHVGNYGVFGAPELQALGFRSELAVGFRPGAPSAVVTSPRHETRIRGDSVTVRGRLGSGSPLDVSPTLGVRFDYRGLPFGQFAPIPARNPNHLNPDMSYPYFIHWDVSSVPEGDYELRAVAHDLSGTADPTPETITIAIDHAGPADVDEYINADGRQENQTAVDSAAENKIASGDHTEASTATELTLSPGSLLNTTDTAKLVYPDPVDEEGQLEQVEQSIDAFVDLSLLSGQIDLEAGLTGDLNISFADADGDGVVDGTSICEQDLQIRRFDPTSGSYVTIPSIVLTEHNFVHADVPSLGKYTLTGPLLPRISFEADKETISWESVSAALSYTVYRGELVGFVDLDADGLPDAGYGECQSHLDPDVGDTAFSDPSVPSGGGWFYLVGFLADTGEKGLGNTSEGLRREVVLQCP